MLRKGKHFYVETYKKALELYHNGYSIKEISNILGISYSTCHAWISKKRTPKKDIVTKFYEFLKLHGPSPIMEIKKEFSKHSDIYLLAIERGFKINRYKLPRIFKEYSIWYYLEGQEKELLNRINDIINKRNELKEKLTEEIFKKIKLVEM